MKNFTLTEIEALYSEGTIDQVRYLNMKHIAEAPLRAEAKKQAIIEHNKKVVAQNKEIQRLNVEAYNRDPELAKAVDGLRAKGFRL